MDVPELTRVLLALHERSHELGFRSFQSFVFEQLRRLVPFDGALLGAGSFRSGVPIGHDFALFGKPTTFLEEWEHVRHEDRIAIEALSAPGRAANHDLVRGSLLEGYDGIRAHCRKWGLSHILCTAAIDPSSGLFWVMSLYRAEDTPFTEDERASLELVVPHVVAASRQARFGQLRGASSVGSAPGHAAAVVSRDGIVIDAETPFATLLRMEHPGWSGPLLPRDLSGALKAERSVRLLRDRLVVRFDAVDGVWLVHVRPRVPADDLSPREREIAEAFSLGATHREIGVRLGIAPNTVRRHLANLYRKLGIASKAELDRMIGDLT